VLPQHIFWSITASILTVSYCDCCHIRTDTNSTAFGTVTCLSFVPLLSAISKKTTLPLSYHCPDVSVTSTVAKQLTAHPSVQVTFLQTKCTTVVTVDSFLQSWYLHFGVTLLNAIWSFFWHWYRPKTDIFWNIKFFLLGELRKIFLSTSGHTRGRIFLSGIPVVLLNFLYVCPVFSSNLVLFLFNSDWRDLFFFLLFGSCFLSLRSNLNFAFYSMHKPWPHAMKNCCYQKCLNMDHHLMYISARSLNHQFDMVIQRIVKQ